jgi:hypothetical protein
MASSSPSPSVEQRILTRLAMSVEEAIPYERLKRELNLGAAGGEGVIRQLMEQNRVRLRRGTGGDNQIFISLVNNINESLSLVLDAVRASGETGIDQTQLLSSVRMPKAELGKALAALAAKNLIKEHRSFTNRAKRIYTLFHIDPSAHVTGGTMYCGEDLDTAFVDEWRRELVRFVSTRRMVGFDQIKRHVEAVQSANTSSSSNGGGGGAAGAGTSTGGGGDGGTSPTAPLVVTMIDSAYLRPSVTTASGTSAASAGSSSSVGNGSVAPFSSKQLSEVDLRTLVHTLVLDGVLEMLVPDSQEEVSAPQYQIAFGQNVMRHFTVQARLRQRTPAAAAVTDGPPPRQRLRRDGGGFAGAEAGVGVMLPSSSSFYAASRTEGLLPDIEHDNLGSTMDALRQVAVWEPAPVSQPSAQEAVDGWSYMPALGFPCLSCPQLERCSVSGRGVINPKSCAYLKDWLS